MKISDLLALCSGLDPSMEVRVAEWPFHYGVSLAVVAPTRDGDGLYLGKAKESDYLLGVAEKTFFPDYSEPEKEKDYPEELTTAMHSEFTISDETDRMHRVWTAQELEAEGYPLAEALEMQQVTMADYDRYWDTYPGEK